MKLFLIKGQLSSFTVPALQHFKCFKPVQIGILFRVSLVTDHIILDSIFCFHVFFFFWHQKPVLGLLRWNLIYRENKQEWQSQISLIDILSHDWMWTIRTQWRKVLNGLRLSFLSPSQNHVYQGFTFLWSVIFNKELQYPLYAYVLYALQLL